MIIAKYFDPYKAAYDPPELPTPCTPADLTPTMAVAMPPELQAEFCARWNALTGEVPAGAGMADDMAYWCALDLCRANGWMQNADGSWAKITVVGGTPEGEMEKAGKVLSAANEAKLRAAADAIAELLALAAPADVPVEGVGKAFTMEGEFTKVDAEQRLAYGYGIVATVDGKVVTDSQDDQIVDFASMEKAALDYAISSRSGKLMHKGEAAYSVPFIMPMTSEIAKSLGMTVKKEGVIIAMHFPATEAGDKGWEMAKDGGGFSVGGKGSRS
tara:strand:+ start:2356 stop:3171 length:816 start_codon:yes stop_codon:yes gene_type:complete